VYAGYSLFRRNPQATKSGPERCRLHPEQGRRSILAIHPAVTLRQGSFDVGTLHALDLRERQDARRLILHAAGRRLLWQPLPGFPKFELEPSSRADQGALDDVLQLADIARPIVTLEPLDVAASRFSRRELELLAEVSHEVRGQRADVRGSVP